MSPRRRIGFELLLGAYAIVSLLIGLTLDGLEKLLPCISTSES